MRTNHLGKCLMKRRFKKETKEISNPNSVTYNTNIKSFIDSTETKKFAVKLPPRLAKLEEENNDQENIKSNTISHEEKVRILLDKKVDEIVERYNVDSILPPRISKNHTTNKKIFQAIESKVFTKWKNRLMDTHILERNVELWRQFFISVERCDTIIQIVDIRNIELFICHEIFSEYGNKNHVIFLNKCDLLGLEPGRYENYEDMNDSNNIKEDDDNEKRNISLPIINKLCDIKSKLNDLLRKGIKIYFINENFTAADILITEFKKGTFAFTGFPNAGKSSTINKILDKKQVKVSKTPGKTKHLQSLYLNEDIIIIDTPGIVFPRPISTRTHLLLLGVLNIDTCDIKNLIDHIIDCVGLNNLINFYKIDTFVNDSRNEVSFNFMNAFTNETNMDYGKGIKTIARDFMEGCIKVESSQEIPQKNFDWYRS